MDKDSSSPPENPPWRRARVNCDWERLPHHENKIPLGKPWWRGPPGPASGIELTGNGTWMPHVGCGHAPALLKRRPPELTTF